MTIFNSYVSLPEGTLNDCSDDHQNLWALQKQLLPLEICL
jgi:hypothetical protein